ncbi:MAG: DUF192 domain-containing protein [Coriobacteriaceae bacterium]|nr:DUF192 domain-containing protein [Coriobacteriaceae bacterium]
MEAVGWGGSRLVLAERFWERLLGMHAVSACAPDGVPYVLALPRCPSVHTCFMRCAIDIAFIGADGVVLARHSQVPP